MLTVLLPLLALAADPEVHVGIITSPSGPLSLASPPVLTPCLPVTSPIRDPWPTGVATLEVDVRRGKVALVATTTANPSVQPLTACFERELAAYAWPVRRGRFAVPIDVAPAPSAPLDPPPPLEAAPEGGTR